MAYGDLTLTYYGRSYTFTFSGSAITPSTQVFAVDDYVTFTTTGTLPTGLALSTVYRVVSVGATIAVSATEGGTPISLSGGSGTHSIRVVLSVIFKRFLDNKLPRESVALSGEGTFSVNGNFIISGISFESPQRYTIQSKVSTDDVDTLRAMFWTTDKIRRELGSPYLTLSDWQTEYFEEGKTSVTKTRSAVATTTPRQGNGGVYYYPILQVFLSREPDFGIDTGVGFRNAVLELQETGVKI
jgi:hypothetical protein